MSTGPWDDKKHYRPGLITYEIREQPVGTIVLVMIGGPVNQKELVIDRCSASRIKDIYPLFRKGQELAKENNAQFAIRKVFTFQAEQVILSLST